MNQLKIEFENCFGIEKLDKEFNFTPEHNVNLIYAKNGLMKTSFTKVFKKFQEGKEDEIGDLIFKNTPVIKNIFEAPIIIAQVIKIKKDDLNAFLI